jgi:hypothetical protein
LYIIINIAASVPKVPGKPIPMPIPRAIWSLGDKELASGVAGFDVGKEELEV